MKKFTTAEIRDLLNQVYREEISFSRMVEMINERVNEIDEPQYKDGDFVVNEAGCILIFKEKFGDFIYDHAYLAGNLMLFTNSDPTSCYGIKRYATEAEKQKLLDALAKEGKRWNEEKKCIEDIPKRKFKKGDKVRIKDGISSKTHHSIAPNFVVEMDDIIGKTITVNRYTEGDEYVVCEETEYIFLEEWLEPYEEDIPKRKFKKGDKVVLKSGYKKQDGLTYLDVFDLFIGKPLTIKGYTDIGSVFFSDCPYIFDEDWLEPYEGLKEGDLAIFWDNNKRQAIITVYKQFHVGAPFPYQDCMGCRWINAIKFESKEQFEKLIKGEI